MQRIVGVVVATAALLAGTAITALTPTSAAPPTTVTLAGSLQSEAGCSGDWQPDCAITHLVRSGSTPVWSGTFALPAGAYDYKIALDDSWVVNYGAGGAPDGANLGLMLAAPSSVRFYFDEVSHWIADSESDVIATVPGSFQSELGCPGDWQPDCLASLLEDIDGDGTSTFSATLSPGTYEAKVAIGESWNENYGTGGTPGGANIAFTVPPGGGTTFFAYDEATHVLVITTTPLDTTPPFITGWRQPPANADGWNNTDVDVGFVCADEAGGSGVAAVDPPVTLTTEGADQSVTGTCTDNAGNIATAVVSGIDIDRSAPVVAFSGNTGTYDVDAQIDIGCTATDSLSGVATSSCTGVSGAAATFGSGAHTVTSSATDRAGNTGTSSATFTVRATPDGLCRLTRHLVTTGVKYRTAPARKRVLGDAAAGAACRVLRYLRPDTTPAKRRGILAAYITTVEGLRLTGWLTHAQSTMLSGFARTL